MKYNKMNGKGFPTAIIILISGHAANAQEKMTHKTVDPYTSLTAPYEVFDHLYPVKLEKTAGYQPGRPTELFGFELEKIKQSFPAMIYTETAWIPNGKSNPKTESIYRVDLKQLMPVL